MWSILFCIPEWTVKLAVVSLQQNLNKSKMNVTVVFRESYINYQNTIKNIYFSKILNS